MPRWHKGLERSSFCTVVGAEEFDTADAQVARAQRKALTEEAYDL
jgi:hypothetical protein